MKANEIISAIGVPANKRIKEHAQTLANIYAHLSSIKNEVVSVDIVTVDFNYGNYGYLMPGEKWTVKTKTGSYSVSLPTGNSVYYAFALLLPAFVSPVVAPTIESDRKLILSGELLKEVVNALKFTKLNGYSDIDKHVYLIVKEGGCFVYGTDRHVLYKSLPIAIDCEDGEFILPAKELKAAIQKNKKEVCIEFVGDKIVMNGLNSIKVEFEIPKFDNVIPTYINSIEVNRKKLIEAITLVSLQANKITKQVNMHFNGAIGLSAEDIDFSYESQSVVKYVKKDTIDFDWSVNANNLLIALKSLETETVELYSNGEKNKCLMMGNKSQVAKVLLMPIVQY